MRAPKAITDCCLDFAHLASFGSVDLHPETDLVRGGNPGHTFGVMNWC
jgi:hypothetical protein